MAPSSSGLGLWLLKSATRVRIPSGLPTKSLISYVCEMRDFFIQPSPSTIHHPWNLEAVAVFYLYSQLARR